MIEAANRKPSARERIGKTVGDIITNSKTVVLGGGLLVAALVHGKAFDWYVWERCQNENKGGFGLDRVRDTAYIELRNLRGNEYRNASQEIIMQGLTLAVEEDTRVSTARWECVDSYYRVELGDSPSLDLNAANSRLLGAFVGLTELAGAMTIEWRRAAAKEAVEKAARRRRHPCYK